MRQPPCTMGSLPDLTQSEACSNAELEQPHTSLERLIVTAIYGLTDPRTGLIRYVGKSENPEKRLKGHLRDRRKCHRVSWLQSLTALGLRPGLTILEEIDDENWQDAERKWIKHFREQGIRLTNSTDGGEGLENPSEETRKKISEKATGRVHSDEQRKRQSERQKGMPGHFRGRKHTEEARARISAAKKGSVPWITGRKHSEETRLKMSRAAQKRGEVSEETRGKLSRATKAYIQTPEGAEVLARAHAMAQTPEACARKSIAQKARAQTDEGKAHLARMLIASHAPEAQAKRNAALMGNQNGKREVRSKYGESADA